MRILVTGTSGFIGSVALKKLINKYGRDRIIEFSSSDKGLCPYLSHNNYSFKEDYFVKNGFADIDTVVHIGAFIPKNSKEVNDVKQCTSNIINTEKLLFSRLPALKKIIFISTVDVYPDVELITEEIQPLPVSLYGHSKLYCEKMVENFSLEKNITCQILRVGHVYGPGEEKYQKMIPLTINKILKSENVEIWGDGESVRTFIHVEDVAKAICCSLDLDSYDGPINIVGDEEVTINDLVDKLTGISGKDIFINHKPTSVANRNLRFDNKKLKQTLNIDLKPLIQGLKDEYDYLKVKNEVVF